MTWHYFANPNRFLKIYMQLMPVFLLLALGALGAGIYYSLFASPIDYQQGEMVRMMYLHVPAAWLALMLYVSMVICNCFGLIWKNPFGYLLAEAIAPVGLLMTMICLATGAIWGKPIWGTWWVWDARLTSMFILGVLYLAYIIFLNSFEQKQLAQKFGAYLTLIGLINLPIIKYSVDWWYSLHQPSSISFIFGSSTIDPAMMKPLWLMSMGLLALNILIVGTRVNRLFLEISQGKA